MHFLCLVLLPCALPGLCARFNVLQLAMPWFALPYFTVTCFLFCGLLFCSSKYAVYCSVLHCSVLFCHVPFYFPFLSLTPDLLLMFEPFWSGKNMAWCLQISLLPVCTAHCTPHTVQHTLHTVHYTLHTVHCHFKLHTVHCTVLHTPNCPLNTTEDYRLYTKKLHTEYYTL